MTVEADHFPQLVKLITRNFMQDPYSDLAEIRCARAATPIENNGLRMWVVGRYDDARTVLADQGLRKDLVLKRREILAQSLVRPERRPRLPVEIRRNMLDRDEPDHTRLRGLLASSFTTAKAELLRPKVEQLVTELLDRLPLDRPVELIGEFIRPLAVTVIADLLGVPSDDRDQFPNWENDILTSPDLPEIEQAGAALVSFARKLIARKGIEPADDLLTGLVGDHQQGVLDDAELVSMVTLMLIAGMEPGSAIANGVFTLLQHPDQWEKLVTDPTLLPGCVDEILRFESPFRMLTPRFSDCPMQLGEVTIPANELILVSVAAANRDPAKFPDPDNFDITRTARGHLGFGRGNHRCLGAHLGVLEMQIALEGLRSRFPNMALAVPVSDVSWRPGMFMRRLFTLPVRLDNTTAGARAEQA
ncbi:cytochrome P450 family protein [Nocardia brasiliensis]|uniref:cytochrome P450 family protein n=1 Tax=Nocardia brasiliensis TaxID=37326 RepID=UPI002457AAF3|nr:cytochrome P450 [Nocardia brasiliensis]